MLKIKCFVCNPIQENTYIVSDSTGEAAIIDCGAWFPEEREAIKEYVTSHQLKPVLLLGTHGHLDHHLGDSFVFHTWGLKPQVHEGDKALMQTLPEQAQNLLQLSLTADDFVPVGRYLNGNDVIRFGNHVFTIIETPGHSQGSVIFYCEEENLCFSGDLLFKGSIGRTDLPGGSMFQMIQSLRHICQLPDSTKVYPGHGEPTTIGYEVATNPYLDR